jgi:hypothetical protein
MSASSLAPGGHPRKSPAEAGPELLWLSSPGLLREADAVRQIGRLHLLDGERTDTNFSSRL